jgi:hypothetical protein
VADREDGSNRSTTKDCWSVQLDGSVTRVKGCATALPEAVVAWW